MIAFDVRLNGKRICIAGAEDLAVLTTSIHALGKLGASTVPARPDEEAEVFYSIGGLTSRSDPDKDVHMRWKSSTPLKVGDVIQVRVLEVNQADPPKSRKKAVRKRAQPNSVN